jgi:serine/threonine-protein kinase
MGMAKLTRTGMVFGTPANMAPEQALGRPLDGRTDLYSLAVTLFECLTGRHPFIGDSPVVVVRKHIREPAPRLADIVPGAPFCTPHMEYLVGRALEKDPGARFADAVEMLTALDEAFKSIGHLPAED